MINPTYSGTPSGGSTTERILSMSLYFKIRSLTVVDVKEGEAFTCSQKIRLEHYSIALEVYEHLLC